MLQLCKDTDLHDKYTDYKTQYFTGSWSQSGCWRTAPFQPPPLGIPPKDPKFPMACDAPQAMLEHIFIPFLSEELLYCPVCTGQGKGVHLGETQGGDL